MSDDIKLYGRSDEERLLDEKRQSRGIIQEILNFGVSERQKYQIMKLLAFELENFDHMKALTAVIDELEVTDVGDITGKKDETLRRIVGDENTPGDAEVC